MINILGYFAMMCLICAAIPQAIKSIRDGHSNGIAGGFVVLLLTGFISMLSFLALSKPIWPVMVNYAFNIVMISVIGYYKLFPRVK
jgi:uncharacterized protein with PQ loop repeat